MNIKNLIIGFGKAGKTLASYLADKGEEVVLIEKSEKMYGGTCINVGCIPTKTLISQAEKNIPLSEAVAHKNKLITFLRAKNFEKLDNHNKVEVITGEARFIGAKTVEIISPEGKSIAEYTAERIFINTGTKSFIPLIDGVNVSGIYDSTSIMELENLPKKLCIVGGGFIGLEFASMFADFGSEVVILDNGEISLPREDRDMAEAIVQSLSKKGIDIINKVAVQKFEEKENGVLVKYNDTELYADAVLVATGRIANTENLNLDKAGIETDARGFIKVNDLLQTNIEGVWALGDVNGGPQFTYISLDDFRIIKNQLSGGKYNSRQERKDFAFSVFIDPPYAHIGLKEKDIDLTNPHIKVQKLPAGAIPKARVLSKTDGLLKAIVDTQTEKILGCTLFCAEAHELINTVKLAMDNELSYKVLRDQVFTHPTMSEALNDLFNI